MQKDPPIRGSFYFGKNLSRYCLTQPPKRIAIWNADIRVEAVSNAIIADICLCVNSFALPHIKTKLATNVVANEFIVANLDDSELLGVRDLRVEGE